MEEGDFVVAKELESQHNEKPGDVVNTDASQIPPHSPQSRGLPSRNLQRHAETVSNSNGQYSAHTLEHLATNLSGMNHNGGYDYAASDFEADHASNNPSLKKTFPTASKNIGEIAVTKKESFGWRPHENNKIYWIPGSQIASDVLHNHISFAGPLATYRKFEFQGQMGYLIENAEYFMDSVSNMLIRAIQTLIL
jgi:hypothetical protein